MAKPVKIKLCLFLCAALALCAGCATEPQRSENADSNTAVERSFNNALFPGCKFTPLQTGVFNQCLVGKGADCVFILNPLVLITEQRSGVVSLGLLGCQLEQNYGLVLGAEPVVHWGNYGILCGWITGTQHDNYGMQIGILNVNDTGNRIQLCGVNLAERLRVGLVNVHLREEPRSWLNVGLFNVSDSFLDIGLFNVGDSPRLQIGVLNNNRNALIPWMLLFNCFFGERREPPPSREFREEDPDRTLVAPAALEKKATDR